MRLFPLQDADTPEFDSDSLVYLSDTEFAYNYAVPEIIIEDIKSHSMMVYGGYYHFEKGDYSPRVYLTCRGKRSGKFKLKIQNFLPYCYKYTDEGDFKTYLGKPCEKLVLKGQHPANVKFLREGLKSRGYPQALEADILFVRRFLIDTYDYFKPTEKINPTYAIVDIETNYPENDDIISFAINNPDGDIYYESKYDTPDKDELALSLYEKLQEFDVVLAWMGEDSFDLKIMDKAFQKIDKPPLTESVVVLDLIEISRKMHGREIRGNWSLDNAGKRLCGIAKSLDEDDMKLDVRELAPDKLMIYNVTDTLIPEIIDEFLGGLEGHLILAWSLQSMLEDMVIVAVANDIALLRAYHKAGIVLNSRDYTSVESKDAKYSAADPDAISGVYDGVIETDVVAAYASAVVAINASCETKDENGIHIAPNGVRFNDGKSIFIDTIKELIAEKNRITKITKQIDKDTEEYKKYKSILFAVKTQVAAFSHGLFGWKDSRMRDYEVADSITSVLSKLLQKLKTSCELIGIKWIYLHTDSLFISAPKEKTEEILMHLNQVIKEHCKDYIIIPELEFKGYHPHVYIHSAARRVIVPEGVEIDDDENWIAKGCNFIRSETPDPIVEIEIALIKLKLKHEDEKLLDTLKEMVKGLKEKEITELSLVKPFNKRINEYGKLKKDGTMGSIPHHITALKLAQEAYGLKIPLREKFGMIPILTNEFTGVRVKKRKKVEMAFDLEKGLPSEYEIDWINYLDSNLFGKISGIFNLKARELKIAVLDEEVKKKLGIESI